MSDLISRQEALAEFIDGRDVFDIMESIEQLNPVQVPNSDLISRQDTIDALYESGLCYNNWLEVRNEIEALPSAEGGDAEVNPKSPYMQQSPNNGADLISRADAIEALGEEPDIWTDTEEEWAYRNSWVEHISAIKALPSAEAYRPSGMWINTQGNQLKIGGYSGYCSACHEWSEYLTDYCGKCGAYMVKENE